MIQMPHEFFFDECLKSCTPPSFGKYGVRRGFSSPREIRGPGRMLDIFNRSAEKLGLKFWPTARYPWNKDGIGFTALTVEPEMEQVFIVRPDYINNPGTSRSGSCLPLRNYAAHTIQETVKKTRSVLYRISRSYKVIVQRSASPVCRYGTISPTSATNALVSAFGLVPPLRYQYPFVETGAAIPLYSRTMVRSTPAGQPELAQDQ